MEKKARSNNRRAGSRKAGKILGLFLLAGTILALGSRTPAAVYKAAGDKRNLVTFVSEATLETITGRTSAVSAEIQADPAKLGASKARFEVDLASLDSGVGMRDQHMKSPMYLDVEKYPKAVFELSEVKDPPKVEEGKPVTFTALGSFSVHGVTRKVAVMVTVVFIKGSEATRAALPGNLLKVRASFTLRLDDFGIKRPEMMMLKVAESVDVKLDLIASDAS